MARAAVIVKLASAHFFCLVACVLVVHVSVEPAFAFSSDPAPRTPGATDRAVMGGPLDEYPKPLIDQGYFDHGGGKYVAEDGTVLLWRNGRFEHENGDPVHTAESLKAAFREFGVELPDFVVGIGQLEAEQEPDDGLAATDEYLHVAWAGGAATGKTGLKMDVNVHNRASEGDYYLLYMHNTSASPYPDFGWEITDAIFENLWEPFLHITYATGPDFQKYYYNYQFQLVDGGSRWANLKIARNQVNGKWNVYFDNTPVEYDLYWPYSPVYNLRRTQLELTSPINSAPHDPGNHYAGIYQRQSNYSTWELWHPYTIGANGPYVDIFTLKNHSQYLPGHYSVQFGAAYYDWLARD